MQHRGIFYIFVLLLITGLTACGFQLRGQVKVPGHMQPLYIQSGANAILTRELRNSLLEAGVQLTDNVDQAKTVLRVYREEMYRRILSVGNQATARQYESVYELSYKMILPKGKVLIPESQILLRRDYSFDEKITLGKEREEHNLQQEMQLQAVQTILRRMRYSLKP